MSSKKSLTLDDIFKLFETSWKEALQTMPEAIEPKHVGLMALAIAAGLAKSLGASKAELELHWAQVMKELDAEAQVEENRSKFRIIV